MKHILFLILAAFLINASAYADNSQRNLTGFASADLQMGLEKRLNQLGFSRAIKKKQLAVAIADITDPKHPRFAQVNGNEMIYAASLPKIAILFGAMARVERGDMQLDDETREQLTQMIRFSSNRAATEMLNRVGKQFLADLLQDPRYGLYDPARNGGLWVGKEYSKRAVWKRDPLHNLSHGATAVQAARFYYLLETGQLVSPALTREMKAILGDPGIQHKFVKGILSAFPEAKIFRKSGSWRHWHADSAIIEHDGRRYIAVALAANKNGGEWLSRMIVALDRLVIGSSSVEVALLD